ncbi:dihydropteroate synthase [soil metagenome]
MSILWRIRDQIHDLSQRGMIMGVLNVTPDSFSDGGQFIDAGRAVEHGLQMIADGADIIDVGGESTRPGADPVSVDEELRRVVPIIEKLRCETSILISVDTMKAEVARAAVAAGADILNDVNGFRDPALVEVAASSEVGLIVMHMLGTPRTMQKNPVYTNVIENVRGFFTERLATLQKAGIVPERVALDPGFGFGKTVEHNLTMLREMDKLRIDQHPMAIGVSRKSMIARLLEDQQIENRFWPTVALTAWIRNAGAEIARVHEVKPNVEAMRMMEAIMQSGH